MDGEVEKVESKEEEGRLRLEGSKTKRPSNPWLAPSSSSAAFLAPFLLLPTPTTDRQMSRGRVHEEERQERQETEGEGGLYGSSGERRGTNEGEV